MVECVYCKTEFKPKHGNQKYCSDQCKRDRRKSYFKKYNDDRSESRKEYDRQYRKDNVERIKDNHKKWETKNRERRLKYFKDYHAGRL